MTDDDLIDMDIRVVFPQSITPTIIPNFNVFLPMFTQNIQDLTKINFGSVNIDGSFRTINVTVCPSVLHVRRTLTLGVEYTGSLYNCQEHDRRHNGSVQCLRNSHSGHSERVIINLTTTKKITYHSNSSRIVDASITLVKPIYRTTPTKFLLDTGDE